MLRRVRAYLSKVALVFGRALGGVPGFFRMAHGLASTYTELASLGSAVQHSRPQGVGLDLAELGSDGSSYWSTAMATGLLPARPASSTGRSVAGSPPAGSPSS